MSAAILSESTLSYRDLLLKKSGDEKPWRRGLPSKPFSAASAEFVPSWERHSKAEALTVPQDEASTAKDDASTASPDEASMAEADSKDDVSNASPDESSTVELDAKDDACIAEPDSKDDASSSSPDSKDDASTAVPDGASTVEPDSPSSASNIDSGIVSGMPAAGNTTILRNVSHAGPHKDSRMEDLIRQTRDLSELVFDEDSLKKMTKKSGWKLSLLVTNDHKTLCGYAITKITNGALSIAKIAVPIEFRGLGFGKLLMDDAMKLAKSDRSVYEVALSSLSTAVTFYQRLGFKALTGVKVQTDFEVVEGQVYMVKKLRPRPKGK